MTIDPSGAGSSIKVANVAVPVSDIPETEWVLRQGECTLKNRADVIEFNWYWNDAIINDCPGVMGGGTFNAGGTDVGERTAVIELVSEGGSDLEYQIKNGLSSPALCKNDDVFADAEAVTVSAGQFEAIDVSLPEDEGFQFSCVQVAGSAPAVLIFNVDKTPPAEGPEFAVTELDDGALSLDPLFDPPEIVDIQWLYGPADSIECSARDEYMPYFRQPLFVEPGELPLRLCAVAFDLAGNESPVSEQVLTGDDN